MNEWKINTKKMLRNFPPQRLEVFPSDTVRSRLSRGNRLYESSDGGAKLMSFPLCPNGNN